MKLVECCPCGEVLGVELGESSLSPVDETVLRLLNGTLLVWIIIIFTVTFVQRELIFRIKSDFQRSNMRFFATDNEFVIDLMLK
jgi:hypothetical protein